MSRTRPSTAERGFTLIELLVVVVIIGVLAAIALPIYLAQKERATEAAVKSDLKAASVYAESYVVDQGSYLGLTEGYLTAQGFKKSVGTANLAVAPDADGGGYCLSAQVAGGRSFYLDSDVGAVVTIGCG